MSIIPFDKINKACSFIRRKLVCQVDISESRGIHPLKIINNHPANSYLMIWVPVEKLRAFGGRRLEADTHPFIDIIQKNPLGSVLVKSPLDDFSSKFVLLNAAHALGLTEKEAPGFSSLEIFQSIYPWERSEQIATVKSRAKLLEGELNKYVSNSKVFKSNDRKGIRDAEVNRLMRIYKSICERGFDKHVKGFTPLNGNLLIHEDGSWVVLVKHGEHRVAALASLGEKNIPIVLSAEWTVRLSDAEFWPQVSNYNININAARDVFLRVYAGGNDAPLVNVAGYFI